MRRCSRSIAACALTIGLITLAACNLNRPDDDTRFSATVPADLIGALASSVTPAPTAISPTPTATFTDAATVTASATPTITPTLTPAGTQPLVTLTPAAPGAVPPFQHQAASFSPLEGWSCGDFPCADDIDGFLQRIRVPEGYTLEHAGRFPGQPMQITYGRDGRLYATVLENGSRSGAVYALDADGAAQRIGPTLISPVGLAFQPGTDVLYVSARITLEQGGGLWRINPDGSAHLVIDDLPCCFSTIDNQPNGLTFGPDGYLYLGVGSTTDHLESDTPDAQEFTTMHPLEAAVLRIQPHTGEVEAFARGIRNPYDVAFSPTDQLYASDNGLVTGPGDRLLRVDQDANYGWPYWRERGCAQCPLTGFGLTLSPDLVRFPDYSLPRGLVVYDGASFPSNLFGSVFVALWNGTPDGQRVVRIDPAALPTDLENYTPEPFITGLIRPVDVAVAPDGSLVVADFIYGHVWRVRYTGAGG
jgi:hypothetical protein